METKLPPAVLLAGLIAMGVAAALFLKPGKRAPAARPAPASSPSAAQDAGPAGADLTKQITLLEGQVEYLQGQVRALTDDNKRLMRKLADSGARGVPKMVVTEEEKAAPDFVGLGLDLVKLRRLQALPVQTVGAPMAEVERVILAWLRKQQPGDEGPRLGLALAALGWIDKPVDPLPLRAALMARQIGGWYDEESEMLLVVDEKTTEGMPAPDRPLAVAFGQLLREFGRTLFPEGRARLTTDARLAREALIAGDASLTRFLLGLEHRRPAEERMTLPPEDPDHPLNEVPLPLFFRELSVFPFSKGLEFAQNLRSAGDFGQVNAAYSRPPANTAEVIDAGRYFDNNNTVAAPPIVFPSLEVAGSKPFWDDSLGRFACFAALRTYNSDDAAGAASQGWAADRLLVYPAAQGPRDHAAWQVLLTDAAAASAFFTAMREVLTHRYDIKPPGDEGGRLAFTARDRHVELIRNRGGLGVLLIDAGDADFASALRNALDGLPKGAP
jgi:hypothetical protein